jgi:hypothetical protein
MAENNDEMRRSRRRSRLKRSLRRLSGRITSESNLEEIARETAALHELAQRYVAEEISTASPQ